MRTLPICLTALALFTGTTALTLPARAALPPTPYERAVMDYEESARRQLEAYKTKINAGLKDDNLKQRYVLAKLKLDECFDLLARLKDADEPHFDSSKAAFEKALFQLIERVRQAEAP